MEEKILRYLELSKLFEKSEIDLFNNHPTTSFQYSGGVTMSVKMSYEEQETKPRAQVIRETAEKEAKLAEDWEEYKELQKNLINYYTAKQKLNGGNCK